MSKWARRCDPNERAIIDALKAQGASVQQLDGTGVPDLLVGYEGRTWLLEVKQEHGKAKAGGKRTEDGLRDSQRDWIAAWRGVPVACVVTVVEAYEALGIKWVDLMAKKRERQAPKEFQGPGTSGHPLDCHCAACRNFGD